MKYLFMVDTAFIRNCLIVAGIISIFLIVTVVNKREKLILPAIFLGLSHFIIVILSILPMYKYFGICPDDFNGYIPDKSHVFYLVDFPLSLLAMFTRIIFFGFTYDESHTNYFSCNDLAAGYFFISFFFFGILGSLQYSFIGWYLTKKGAQWKEKLDSQKNKKEIDG